MPAVGTSPALASPAQTATRATVHSAFLLRRCVAWRQVVANFLRRLKGCTRVLLGLHQAFTAGPPLAARLWYGDAGWPGKRRTTLLAGKSLAAVPVGGGRVATPVTKIKERKQKRLNNFNNAFSGDGAATPASAESAQTARVFISLPLGLAAGRYELDATLVSFHYFGGVWQRPAPPAMRPPRRSRSAKHRHAAAGR